MFLLFSTTFWRPFGFTWRHGWRHSWGSLFPPNRGGFSGVWTISDQTTPREQLLGNVTSGWSTRMPSATSKGEKIRSGMCRNGWLLTFKSNSSFNKRIFTCCFLQFHRPVSSSAASWKETVLMHHLARLMKQLQSKLKLSRVNVGPYFPAVIVIDYLFRADRLRRSDKKKLGLFIFHVNRVPTQASASVGHIFICTLRCMTFFSVMLWSTLYPSGFQQLRSFVTYSLPIGNTYFKAYVKFYFKWYILWNSCLYGKA